MHVHVALPPCHTYHLVPRMHALLGGTLKGDGSAHLGRPRAALFRRRDRRSCGLSQICVGSATSTSTSTGSSSEFVAVCVGVCASPARPPLPVAVFKDLGRGTCPCLSVFLVVSVIKNRRRSVPETPGPGGGYIFLVVVHSGGNLPPAPAPAPRRLCMAAAATAAAALIS